MAKTRKVKITTEEGNFLLSLSHTFSLPEKLTDELKFDVAEQGLADRDVGYLYEELRSYSPRMRKERLVHFGPSENWFEELQEGKKVWELRNPDLKVQVRLTPDMEMGVYWCLLLALHPRSKRRCPAGLQAQVIWPLAAKMRLTEELRTALGIAKKQHRRLDLDPIDGEKEEEPEVTESPEKS